MARHVAFFLVLLLAGLAAPAVLWAQDPAAPTPTAQPAENPTAPPAVDAGAGRGLPQEAPKPAPRPAGQPVLGGIVPVAPAATGVSRGFGQVALNNVHVRAGRADSNYEIAILPRGYPIEVVSEEGDWTGVRLPGGIVGYARRGSGGREYIERKSPGLGRVAINDLLLRPVPNTDWPAMGRFKPNQEVLILGEENGWYRVLAPEDQLAYIWHEYVRVSADADAARALFDAKAAEVRAVLLEGGALSKADLETVERRKAQAAKLADIDRRYDSLMSTRGAEVSVESLAAIRSEYESLAAAAGDDESLAARATAKAGTVKEKEETLRTIAEAEARVKRIEDQRIAAEKKYGEDVTRFRERKEAEIQSQANERDGRFLRHGLGYVRRDELNAISGRPAYILTKASEDRFELRSSRYDLGEYVGRNIGITGWNFPSEPVPTNEIRLIEVTRFEIID